MLLAQCKALEHMLYVNPTSKARMEPPRGSKTVALLTNLLPSGLRVKDP